MTDIMAASLLSVLSFCQSYKKNKVKQRSRANSTGSDSCDYSTDDEVFGDDGHETSFDEIYGEDDGRPPSKKAFFYIDNTDAGQSDMSMVHNFADHTGKIISGSLKEENYQRKNEIKLTEKKNEEIFSGKFEVIKPQTTKTDMILSDIVVMKPHQEVAGEKIAKKADSSVESSSLDNVSLLGVQTSKQELQLCSTHVDSDAGDASRPRTDTNGGFTPPIFVELCPDTDSLESYNTNSFQMKQSSSLCTAKTSDYSREEREPTPFFKDSVLETKHSQHSYLQVAKPSSVISSESARAEREPTPYFDDSFQQKSVRGAQAKLDKNLSADSRQEFHRESTPFFYDKTRMKSAPHAEGDANPARVLEEGAAALTENFLSGTVLSSQSSLAVPVFLDCNRHKRESTPFYNQNDPYENIRHSDHQFSDKKLVLVKQNSEENYRQLAQASSAPPDILLPVSPVSTKPTKSHSQPVSPPSIAEVKSGHLLTEDRTSQSEKVENQNSAKQRDRKRTRSRQPVTLESEQTKILEIKHDFSPSTTLSIASPVLAYIEQPTIQSQHLPALAIFSAGDNLDKSKHLAGAKVLDVSKTYEKGLQESVMIPENATQKASAKPLTALNSARTEPPKDKELQRQSVESIKTRHRPSASAIIQTPQKLLALNQQLPPVSMTVQDVIRNVPTDQEVKGFASIKNAISASHIGSHRVITKNSEILPGRETHTAVMLTAQTQDDVLSNSQNTRSIPTCAKPDSQTTNTKASISKNEELMVSSIEPLSVDLNTKQTNESAPKSETDGYYEMLQKKASYSMLTTADASKSHSCKMSPADLNCPLARQEMFDPMLTDTSTHRQLRVSARDIYPVEIFSDEPSTTGTPPADTAMKRRSIKSGISGAFSKMFKPKSKTEGKFKNVFSRAARKNSSPQPYYVETSLQLTPGVPSAQIFANCSPFGPYTLEGFCLLAVLTIVCLHLDMSIETFVCYVLATFYTFCVMRILGVIQ